MEQPKHARINRFASALVLTGGLTLLGATHANAQPVSSYHYGEAEHRTVESVKPKTLTPKLNCDAIPGVCRADKTVVKAGDPILIMKSTIGDLASLNAVKVDSKGIEIGDLSETLTNQNAPKLRVDFGKPVWFGETWRTMLSITAEKGKEPGTAIVTIATATNTLNCTIVPGVCMADKTVVKAGDQVFIATLPLPGEANIYSVYSSWDIVKVDSKGIEVGTLMEVFMTQATSKLRVDFGKPITSGATWRSMLAITAEKGKEPGTAIVTIAPISQSALPYHWSKSEYKEEVHEILEPLKAPKAKPKIGP